MQTTQFRVWPSPSPRLHVAGRIDTWTIAGLRERALIGVMAYSFARIRAVLGMDVEDYYQQGKRWWIALHEKGGKEHAVPAHHKAEMCTGRRPASSARKGRRCFARWAAGGS
jgi:hypothetical protein